MISFITAAPNLSREGQVRNERGGNMIKGELSGWLEKGMKGKEREGEMRRGKVRLEKR